MPSDISRRRFLRRCAGLGAGLAIVPETVFSGPGRSSPGERIAFGIIGVGGHGMWNLKNFLHQGDAQIVAVCDVDGRRLEKARGVVKARYGEDSKGRFKGPDATKDWREVVSREDIDAVMISTPDHWHVPISVAALRAGKDVCCEKPTLTIAEGRVLADTVRRYGRVFQMATEDRSVHVYHRMAELVRNGRIGKVHTIRVKLWGGSRVAGGYRGIQKPQPVPEWFDYDMWLGPAPEAPYTPGRCHYNFRWIFDYSGGVLTDWGAHLLDTAQWGNDTERTGPVEVEGRGVFPEEGLYDTATEYHIEYRYANGVRLLVDSGGCGIRFEGTDGWVGNTGWRGPLAASSEAILRSVIEPDEIHLYTCREGEHRNFLDCVHSRRDPYFPAEIGHRCSSLLHMGNISMRLGRKLRWDPDAEEFVGRDGKVDDKANRMRSRAMREPWTL